jgi:zinc transport system substrate-binding protein
MKILFFCSLLFFSSTLIAANSTIDTTIDTTMEVVVSIVPQQYFVQRIGGDKVHVSIMVKAGQSPELFEPSPRIMSIYSTALVYFTIGMPFEQVWIKRVASLNPQISIIATQPHEQDLLTANATHHYHKWDPHTWLSPLLAIEQARIIMLELVRLKPQHQAIFWSNFNNLSAELTALHDEFLTLFHKIKVQRFISFHPAFSYFSQLYGLQQISIERDGKEPTAKQIAQVIGQFRHSNVSYLLVERQFNQLIPKTIAQSVGAQVLLLDPLAYDYFINMRDIAHKINSALF